FLGWRDAYGANANWADCYFSQDYLTSFVTAGNLSHAYNVDVDWADPNRTLVAYGSGVVAFSSHGYPQDFYMQTITNADLSWCGTNYGFPLSAEAGGETEQANHPIGNGNNPPVVCGPPGVIPTPTLPVATLEISLANTAHAWSDFGATLASD